LFVQLIAEVYKEFYFSRLAFRKARINALDTALSYLISLLAINILVFTTEKQFPEDFSPIHKFLAFLFLLTAGYMALRAGKALSGPRVFITLEGLNVRTPNYSMTLAFANLVRVENNDGSLLAFYTISSPRLPVLMLSNLEKQGELLDALRPFVAQAPLRSIPFVFTQQWRLLLSFVTNSCIFVQLFSGNFVLFVTTTIGYIAQFIYALVFYLRDRKDISLPASLLISSFLALVFSERLALVLYWAARGIPFHSMI
jgi:hypothetical protein